MNILWIADFSVKENKGGAQQTNDIMIKAGRKRGHKIDIVLQGSQRRSAIGYDLVVLNNVSLIEKEYLDDLVASGRCIRYEHDYWVAENYPELYKRVRRNIFLSPLHLEMAEKIVGYKIENVTLIPSPISSKLFNMEGVKKKRGTVLYTGQLCEKKGIDGFVKYIKDNPHLEFTVIGWGQDVDKVRGYDNVTILDEMEMKDLVEYYKESEYFYHRPEWKEPFGRAVMEAYLCGCSLILNDNVGAVSWDWDFSNYDQVVENLNSVDKFWKVLEDDIQSSDNLE